MNKKIVSIDDFKAASDTVVIDFCKSNKQVFSEDEEVSLDLLLKNVKKLTCKIYEFNAENYYKKKM